METLKKWLEEIREWSRYASIRLAALVAACSGAFTANPELLVGLIGVIPVDPWLRILFSIFVAVVVFLIPVITRIWPQGFSLSEWLDLDEDETDGKA